MHTPLSWTTRIVATNSVAIAAAVLGARGGNGFDDIDATASARPATTQQTADLRSSPDAIPSDPAARTTPALYALPEQAGSVARAMPGAVLRVEVASGSQRAADEAVSSIVALQATRKLPRSAPVFVAARDPRWAAGVVNRLAQTGFSRVYLVHRRAG